MNIENEDTNNTRRYQEEASDGPPIIGTLHVQQWALRKLTALRPWESTR